MKRRTAGRVFKPGACEFCGKALAPQKPKCMVVGDDGVIRGYFHTGCAEKLVAGFRAKGVQHGLPGLAVGQVIPKPREETLPW